MSLGEPRREEIVTAGSLIMAMRTTFRPEAARGIHASYEFRFGEIVFHVRINDAKLTVAEGPLPGVDLIVESGLGIKALMTGEMTPAEAIDNGSVHLTGDPALLTRFAQLFRIDPMPHAEAI